MRPWNLRPVLFALPIAFAGIAMIAGCDSGKKAVDEVTGNRAVQQYHKSKNDIREIADQQAERYKHIPGEDEPDDDTQ
jgi:hypothetical protein